MSFSSRPWAVFGTVLLVGQSLIVAAAGQDGGSGDSRTKRRTPVVEVFENCKDTVVFVTGPVVKAGRPATEEFFVPATPATRKPTWEADSSCTHPATSWPMRTEWSGRSTTWSHFPTASLIRRNSSPVPTIKTWR